MCWTNNIYYVPHIYFVQDLTFRYHLMTVQYFSLLWCDRFGICIVLAMEVNSIRHKRYLALYIMPTQTIQMICTLQYHWSFKQQSNYCSRWFLISHDIILISSSQECVILETYNFTWYWSRLNIWLTSLIILHAYNLTFSRGLEISLLTLIHEGY